MTLKLSILDQSPVISGQTPAQAVQATLQLARRADELGYHRYWLAEHHAIAALADPCPEVLLARLGAETHRMRVGTGGVLLPYYSAFKVADYTVMMHEGKILFCGTPDELKASDDPVVQRFLRGEASEDELKGIRAMRNSAASSSKAAR